MASTQAASSDHHQGDRGQQRRGPGGPGGKPGWMSIPGGPKEPVFADFSAKMQKLNAEKTALFDKVKSISEQLGERVSGPEDEERKALQGRLDVLKKTAKDEGDSSRAARENIQKIREEKYKIEDQLRVLTSELGAFQTLDEIEKAIERILFKMETGTSSLSAEKKTADRLVKLERAKRLLQNLQPLQEAIEMQEAREQEVAGELREITARMSQLRQDMGSAFQDRKALDEKNKKAYEDRQPLIKERSETRDRITKLFAEMDALRKDFDGQRKAWDEWREVAKKKYEEKMEAERAERQRKWKERQDAIRNERKKDKIAKRRNPHAAEIAICSTVVQYLKDKQMMHQKSEEEKKRRDEASNFNPAASVPTGFTLLRPRDEAICLGKPKSSKKKKNNSDKTAAAEEQTNNGADAATTQVRSITHTAEKKALFARIGVEAPAQLKEFADAIAAVQAKQKEFESHIQSGPVEVSSSEEDEAEAEAETTPAVAAAETA